MNRLVTAVRCHRWGDPAEVLQLDRLPLPELRPDQVLVEMKAAPINPADISVIEGKYGSLPGLPCTCGNEGAGVVKELGSAVGDRFSAGQLVRPVPGVGTWCEALVTEADKLISLPAELTTEQAAVLTVNAATAWRMLHDFVPLQPGDWILQNAATSAVGRYVIRLARHLGLCTANVVRRAAAVERLKAEGADLVVTEDQRLVEELGKLSGGRPLSRLALNAVGGKSALNLVKALAPKGVLVTYGAMGREAPALPNGPLIFKELRHEGFWVTAWYRRAGVQKISEMLAELAQLFAAGTLDTFVEHRFRIEEIAQAVALARRGGRTGKVMLLLDS